MSKNGGPPQPTTPKYLNEFSKALALEVKILLAEVGKLRDERHELASLKAKHSAGIDYSPHWRPKIEEPPPPPAIEDSPPVQARPGWRVVHKRPERKPRPPTSSTPAHPPAMQQIVEPPRPDLPSWAQWRPNPLLAPTPVNGPALGLPQSPQPPSRTGIFVPSFPSEIVYHNIDTLSNDKPTLLNCSLVSRLFGSTSQRCLFRTVELRFRDPHRDPGRSARIAQFIDVLTPWLASCIEHLKIIDYIEDWPMLWDGIDKKDRTRRTDRFLVQLLPKIHKLRSFTLSGSLEFETFLKAPSLALMTALIAMLSRAEVSDLTIMRFDRFPVALVALYCPRLRKIHFYNNFDDIMMLPGIPSNDVEADTRHLDKELGSDFLATREIGFLQHLVSHECSGPLAKMLYDASQHPVARLSLARMQEIDVWISDATTMQTTSNLIRGCEPEFLKRIKCIFYRKEALWRGPERFNLDSLALPRGLSSLHVGIPYDSGAQFIGWLCGASTSLADLVLVIRKESFPTILDAAGLWDGMTMELAALDRILGENASEGGLLSRVEVFIQVGPEMFYSLYESRDPSLPPLEEVIPTVYLADAVCGLLARLPVLHARGVLRVRWLVTERQTAGLEVALEALRLKVEGHVHKGPDGKFKIGCEYNEGESNATLLAPHAVNASLVVNPSMIAMLTERISLIESKDGGKVLISHKPFAPHSSQGGLGSPSASGSTSINSTHPPECTSTKDAPSEHDYEPPLHERPSLLEAFLTIASLSPTSFGFFLQARRIVDALLLPAHVGILEPARPTPALSCAIYLWAYHFSTPPASPDDQYTQASHPGPSPTMNLTLQRANDFLAQDLAVIPGTDSRTMVSEFLDGRSTTGFSDKALYAKAVVLFEQALMIHSEVDQGDDLDKVVNQPSSSSLFAHLDMLITEFQRSLPLIPIKTDTGLSSAHTHLTLKTHLLSHGALITVHAPFVRPDSHFLKSAQRQCLCAALEIAALTRTHIPSHSDSPDAGVEPIVGIIWASACEILLPLLKSGSVGVSHVEIESDTYLAVAEAINTLLKALENYSDRIPLFSTLPFDSAK
ncbi:hypothetical protein H0H81_004023 [Sphagnurus paluster]|uniref:Uncharacterized protein n=1 Tax=Sphagnurus paluster TaxID=117069 RepID=A0A9P7KLG9_9AGAR|nr:hypothetical protein H0H81_004023 [Sphagnurus paluster]